MFNLSEQVKHHFYHPKNVGELDLLNPNVIIAEIATPDGHTQLQLFCEIKNSIIVDAKFKALGCPSAIACLSFVTDYLIGKNVQECKTITVEFVVKSLDFSREKYSIAGLVEDLLKQILTHHQ